MLTPRSCLLLVAIVPLVSGLFSSTQLVSGDLSIAVDQASLEMQVSVGGEAWLLGTAFTRHNKTRLTPSEGLVLASPPSTISGTDALGSYAGLSFSWVQAAGGSFLWNTSLRAYESKGNGIVVFRQEFPAGANSTRTTTASTGFPALTRAQSRNDLGFIEYHGSSAGDMVRSGAVFPDGVQGGQQTGAVVIMKQPSTGAGARNPSAHTLVFSQLDSFFGAVIDRVNVTQPDGRETLAAVAGLMAGFDSAPVGFASEAVLVLASSAPAAKQAQTAGMFGMPVGGVNHAVQLWGDTLLKRHGGKARAAVSGPKASVRSKHFGYSTTGFYHHNPCDGLVNCTTWGDSLLQVHHDLRARGVPYRWMLIDSYWYGETRYKGTYLWEDGNWLTTADGNFPARFKPGVGKGTLPLQSLQAQTAADGQPPITFGAHSGIWSKSPATPYFNNSDSTGPTVGEWATEVKDGKNVPMYPQDEALWDHLFSVNKKWGLSMIKQDHISENGILTNDVDGWQRWFDGMGNSAVRNDMSIMYCMAFAPVLLNSVKFTAAEATRASADYIVGRHGPSPSGANTNGQWAIGPDAMFHWAIGLLPYKDTFYSNTTEHSNSPLGPGFNGNEPQPQVHALMAALSAAFVTSSDAVGSANATLLERLYRADGLLLKPTRPVTALDAQLLQSAFSDTGRVGTAISGPNGQLYSTHSHISGLSFTYVVGVTLSTAFEVLPAHMQLCSSTTPDTELGCKLVAFQHSLDYTLADGEVDSLIDVHDFDDDHPLQMNPGSFITGSGTPINYYVIAPVLDNGIVVLGELLKFVPIAEQRMLSITTVATQVVVRLAGVKGEKVTIGFAQSTIGANGTTVYKSKVATCIVATDGSVDMSLPAGTCTPVTTV